MNIWAGWTLNQRKPSSAPMISAHRSARFGWCGSLSRAMIRNATKAKIERAAGQPVEAVGEVDAVARRDDREGGEEHVQPGPISTSPTNGTRMSTIAKWRWM